MPAAWRFVINSHSHDAALHEARAKAVDWMKSQGVWNSALTLEKVSAQISLSREEDKEWDFYFHIEASR